MKLSNKWCAEISGYKYKLNQINSYDWLTQKHLDESYNRLVSLISTNAIFNKKLELYNNHSLLGMNLMGYISCIDKNNVWIFVCVDKIVDEHFLSLVLSAYLVNYNYNDCSFNYYLLNILNGETYQLIFDLNNINNCVKQLFYYKYKKLTQSSTEEFINYCKEKINFK